jgi:hypothetical protein
MWAELALKHGNVQASEFIDKVIKPNLDATEISKAQEMAERCEASKYKDC